MTDKELVLKKTARRRLVGAVTLVVLMLIVLPFVLKDRAVEPAHDNVEITVVNHQANKEPILELPDDEGVLDSEAIVPNHSSAATPATEQPVAQIEDTPALTPVAPKGATVQPESSSSPVSKVEPKVEPKVAAAKPAIKETSTSSDKISGKYFVQFGVFSDPNNLESLQTKLKQAGFDATSEKVDAAGQKLRLRTHTYTTRNEAAAALKKLEAAGFKGIVASKS